MRKNYLSLDIGGTKISAALFTEEGEIREDYICVVPTGAGGGEELVYQNVRSALSGILNHFQVDKSDLSGIGVGSPGPLDTNTGVILFAPLMQWRNFPIAQRLRQEYGVPVTLDNDCNLGALAEHRRGLAKGTRNAIYMTISTGIGGGIIADGQLYHGFQDSAGEFGHICIDPQGLNCPCGGRGCLELYASGTALNRKMQAAFDAGVQSRIFEFAQGKREAINGTLLARAAAEGDAYALSVFDAFTDALSVGLATIFNSFSPEVLVMGGGVTKSHALFEEMLLQKTASRTLVKLTTEQLRYSELCDRVVLYGAYYQIKDKTNLDTNK